ncbi:hypothetical protein HRI_001211200 [Hibiscus trionum]|uniref:Bifunctional inhibitor/plant lipid transfer protein/seed storage helical domain-containing protein n=1 Tax=Hibiscus trionum TaxID=183268 RepID=A0A9W7HD96_HIBTR|nr:hypothetical protein HRI_001211200 [Hibiscus trionum]
MDSMLVCPCILLLFISWGLQGAAAVEENEMGCMEKLMPCEPFVHSSSPPSTCCTPLNHMIKEQDQCLCRVFHDREFLKSADLTKDEALALAKACGAKVDTSVCKNGSQSNNSSDSTKSSSSKSNASTKTTNVHGVFRFIASISTIMLSALYV